MALLANQLAARLAREEQLARRSRLAARTQAEVEKAAEEVRALGRPALALVCDVTDEAAVQAALQRALAEFGRLDVLVNNAGLGPASAELHVVVP